MKIKYVIYLAVFIVVFYTIYKIAIIYVLNVSSLKSEYVEHSNTAESSKKKGLFVAEYSLIDKRGSNISSAFIPKNLFIEREKIVYPNYYFYFGKSKLSNRFTMNGISFSAMSGPNEYHITCPSSTQPNDIFTTLQNNLVFFFEDKPKSVYFTIYGHSPKTDTDTLIYFLAH